MRKKYTYTDEHIKTRIDEVTKILIKEFNPERMILFGSYARASAHEDSSLDILIIARTTLSFIERIKRTIKLTKGDPAIEPLVYTPSELNILLSQGEGFIDNILKEGVLLYSK